MNQNEKILRPVMRIHGGAQLPHNKNTAECESVVMQFEGRVTIPLSQHIGAPCEPLVKKGDSVYVGTKIGQSDAFVSAPIHSSVSGTVSDISAVTIGGKQVRCVIIDSDGQFTPDPSLRPFPVNNAEDIAQAARECGLVGLGGAGFPTHVKLRIGESQIDTLIVNAAECEPYITADYRECMEHYNDVIEGVYLLKSALGLARVVICVESNKPKAIRKLYTIASDNRDADDTVKLMELPASYPQGAEKVIIYSATGRKLPLGKLPGDVGCIVMNVTSVATLYRFITTGMPLVSKRITVDGNGVKEPKNVIVPIGVSIRDVLDFAGGVDDGADEIIMGGPMMGNSAATPDTPVDKRTNALLVMKRTKPQPETPCIHCGRCVRACPMNLLPNSVETAVSHRMNERLSSLNVNYCMECGSCSFVCPAKRPLVQSMRIAKSILRSEKK